MQTIRRGIGWFLEMVLWQVVSFKEVFWFVYLVREFPRIIRQIPTKQAIRAAVRVGSDLYCLITLLIAAP